MATFNRTDTGIAAGRIIFELEANGDPRNVVVVFQLSDGNTVHVNLDKAEAAALLTTTEKNNVRSAMPKLYAGAIAKAGGV
jgi:hypothetical protein